MKYSTEQEEFWAGDFGIDYQARNKSSELLASNISFFAKCLSYTNEVETLLELGANIGVNLQALKLLYPNQEQSAVEINEKACEILKGFLKKENIYNESILDFKTSKQYDLTLIKGVLIHINPDYLEKVYDVLHQTSKKYILICEYYNPTPVSVLYRGQKDKLFKRDFAGDMLSRYDDLSLVDYGFVYHRDSNAPQDDITWFLLKKNS